MERARGRDANILCVHLFYIITYIFPVKCHFELMGVNVILIPMVLVEQVMRYAVKHTCISVILLHGCFHVLVSLFSSSIFYCTSILRLLELVCSLERFIKSGKHLNLFARIR